ncbi:MULTISPECIES: hypothetical protein [Serratia]|uniref:hypothetical protein n=2 Tax=Serratia TaxID=613 RepID=UPI0021011AC1|nr:hypothetical protein [Serratia ureilytica]
MMNETRQHHAYQRGVRMASLWKRLKGTILRWDAFFVSKARKYSLPAWIAHIPMIILAISILATLVFGGMIIASSVVLIGALLLLVSEAFSPKEEANLAEDATTLNTSYKSPCEYRADGEFGPGWYAGNYKVSDDY